MNLPDEVAESAEILWEFHNMHHELRPVDVAIGLGSHDAGVATYTAELYGLGLFPVILFTGANAPTTIDLFPRGEAVHFAGLATAAGVPREAIIVEPFATNTAENFLFAREAFRRRAAEPASAIVVCRPYQQRRAYATCQKLWPELDIVCASRPQSFASYLTAVGDEDRVVNMLVGDTQRITVYAERGFAIHQPIPTVVATAFEALIEAGFTRRLLPS